MQYEACSICILAEVRHAELQSEVERYWSVRRDVSLVPTMSELLIAGAQRLMRGLARVRIRRLQGARETSQFDDDAQLLRQHIGSPGGFCNTLQDRAIG